MTFDEKWKIYKKANLPNWLHDVGDKSPIDTLLEHKYDAFRIGWQTATERAAGIVEEVTDHSSLTIKLLTGREIAQKIRKQ